MMNEVLLLSKVQLCNFFGLNEARFTKDPKKKKTLFLTLICVLIAILAISSSIWSNVFLMVSMGFTEAVPSLITSSVSGTALLLSLLRAGPLLFSPKSYERLAALPVKTKSVIISKFITLYVYNSIFTVVIGFAGALAYAVHANATPLAIIEMFIGALLLPSVPMAAGAIIGTVAYKIASISKKKNLMSTLLSIATVLIVCSISFGSSNVATDEEMMNSLANTLGGVDKYYFISTWFTNGVNGDLLSFILFAVVSIAVSALLLLLIGKLYTPICIGMSSVSSKRNFKMSEQKVKSVFANLYTKEIKRYFGSSVYLMNTIMGFILAVGVSVSILFLDTSTFEAEVGLPVSMFASLMPIVIAAMCNTMPTTAATISMEGKNIWILQTLPVPVGEVMKAKVAVNMTLALPSCLIASTCTVIAFGTNPIESVFAYLIPLTLTLFGSYLGLYVNLLNPMMNWDNETQAVKQSKSALLTMFLLFASEFVAAALIIMLPPSLTTLADLIIITAFALGTVALANKTAKFDLRKIN